MRAWLLSILGYVLLTTAALAQLSGGLMFPGPGAPASAGGGSPTWTAQTSGSNASCGFVTSCTTSATVTIPTGFDVFVVGATNQAGGASTVTTLTVNSPCSGTLTQIVSPSAPSGGALTGLFAGTVTGGSCTMTATASGAGAFNGLVVSLGLLSNLNSTTPTATCSNYLAATQNSPYQCSTTVSASSGGFIIGGISVGGNSTITANTLTVDSTAATANGSAAIGNSTSTTAISPGQATGNFLQVGVVAAAWR